MVRHSGSRGIWYWDFEVFERLCGTGRAFDLDNYDHILFSYGLPERQVDKIYEDRKCANRSEDEINDRPYKATCYATSHGQTSWA